MKIFGYMWIGLNNLCVFLIGFYCNFVRVYKSRIFFLRFVVGCFFLGVGGIYFREVSIVGELVYLVVFCIIFLECFKTSFYNLDFLEYSGFVD